MSVKKSISGPYRATKLWNDAVRSFYNGMPVSRHWRGLRQYDRCFTANEAIDWLHSHLTQDPNFGTNVTRDQTIKLLRKFVKSGLIEDVRSVSLRPDDFKDGRDLYRFSNRSPLKALRTPKTPNRAALTAININNINNKKETGASPVLKRRFYSSVRESSRGKYKVSHVGENVVNEKRQEEGALQQCHLVAKQLTKEQVNNVWKQVYLKKLDSTCEHLLYAPSSSLLPPSSMCGATIRHNATQVSQKGVVKLTENHQDNLPSWVLTAMRCMAQWPNISDLSCNIPNYPGVERDVFKIVKDFFTNMVTPLIPFELYEPLIRVYIGAEFLDISYRSPNSKQEEGREKEEGEEEEEERRGEEEEERRGEEEEELGDGDSVDDLMLNMSLNAQKTSTPNTENDIILPKRRDREKQNKDGRYERMEEDRQRERRDKDGRYERMEEDRQRERRDKDGRYERMEEDRQRERRNKDGNYERMDENKKMLENKDEFYERIKKREEFLKQRDFENNKENEDPGKSMENKKSQQYMDDFLTQRNRKTQKYLAENGDFFDFENNKENENFTHFSQQKTMDEESEGDYLLQKSVVARCALQSPHSAPQTPSLSRNMALNASKLQSLKLRRLKCYTDFKDDSLYRCASEARELSDGSFGSLFASVREDAESCGPHSKEFGLGLEQREGPQNNMDSCGPHTKEHESSQPHTSLFESSLPHTSAFSLWAQERESFRAPQNERESSRPHTSAFSLGAQERESFRAPRNDRESSRPQSRASCESNGAPVGKFETVRSIKTNDQVRRMKKSESRLKAAENDLKSSKPDLKPNLNTNLKSDSNSDLKSDLNLKSETYESHTLPRNCCYETAFTSDSPKTRIIPQKSVDSLHIRRNEGGKSLNLNKSCMESQNTNRIDERARIKPQNSLPNLNKPRPKSIAVLPGNLHNISSESTISDLFKSSLMSSTGNINEINEYSLEKSIEKSIEKSTESPPYNSESNRPFSSTNRATFTLDGATSTMDRATSTTDRPSSTQIISKSPIANELTEKSLEKSHSNSLNKSKSLDRSLERSGESPVYASLNQSHLNRSPLNRSRSVCNLEAVGKVRRQSTQSAQSTQSSQTTQSSQSLAQPRSLASRIRDSIKRKQIKDDFVSKKTRNKREEREKGREEREGGREEREGGRNKRVCEETSQNKCQNKVDYAENASQNLSQNKMLGQNLCQKSTQTLRYKAQNGDAIYSLPNKNKRAQPTNRPQNDRLIDEQIDRAQIQAKENMVQPTNRPQNEQMNRIPDNMNKPSLKEAMEQVSREYDQINRRYEQNRDPCEQNRPQNRNYEQNRPQNRNYEQNRPQNRNYEQNRPQNRNYEQNRPQNRNYEQNRPQNEQPQLRSQTSERESTLDRLRTRSGGYMNLALALHSSPHNENHEPTYEQCSNTKFSGVCGNNFGLDNPGFSNTIQRDIRSKDSEYLEIHTNNKTRYAEIRDTNAHYSESRSLRNSQYSEIHRDRNSQYSEIPEPNLRYDPSHLRTKSGGFLNLALAPSSESMDSGHFTIKSESATLENPQKSNVNPVRCSSASILDDPRKSASILDYPRQYKDNFGDPWKSEGNLIDPWKSRGIYEDPKIYRGDFQNPKQSRNIFEDPHQNKNPYEDQRQTRSIYEAPRQTTTTYEAPRQTTTTYEAPRQTTTTYEAPRQTRSINEDSRDVFGDQNYSRSIYEDPFPHTEGCLETVFKSQSTQTGYCSPLDRLDKMPIGCLSHSLSSSGCSSVYHSAFSTHSGLAISPNTHLELHTVSSSQPDTSASSSSSSSRTTNPFLAASEPSQPARMIDPVSGMGGIYSARTGGCNGASVQPIPPRSPHPYTRMAPPHPYLSPRLLTREGREAAVSSLQLLLLLLPPSLRRCLHLLLRMSSKMSSNPELKLDPHMTTRAVVLSTFVRSILLSSQESDYDEILCVRIVSFLMDNHDFILRPPEDLSIRVHRMLSHMEREQVTTNTYQRQKLTGSQQFLSELLGQIIDNHKLSDKEKKKKLKEFKSLYPEVYKSRFPSEPTKREGKMKGLMKLASLTSLGRNKAIRM